MSSRWMVIASCLFVGLPITVPAQPAKPPAPKDGPLGMKFVPLPKATFYMGWNNDKGSAKKTEIKEAFEIAIHEVTQGQWQEVMGNNPSWFSRAGKGKDAVKDFKDEELKHFPVENVSWNDVQGFIKKLNESEKKRGSGYVYRLPSEAEWEYACRGGATSEEECTYHFYLANPTDELSPKEANFKRAGAIGKAEKEMFPGRTASVGSYAPNKLGLYDMHGNVWEWSEGVANSGRVFRGGAWSHVNAFCQAAIRFWGAQTLRVNDLGFRLVRVPVREQGK